MKTMPPPCLELEMAIAAAPERVWEVLTGQEHMGRWMGGPEMRVEVETDWRPGGPVLVRGIHTLPFENRGRVLHVEPARRLVYTHLSSLSGLADRPEHHTVLAFGLERAAPGTLLGLAVSGFPTMSIYQHLRLYWQGTLQVLKDYAERPGA